MSKTPTDSGAKAVDHGHDALTFHAHGMDKIELPSAAFISDAHMTRDGDNLVLTTPGGETAVVEGYFSADPSPLLSSPDGSVLTPGLVDSFSHSPMEFAANNTANDETPVGAVEEVKGVATVTRADGTVETIAIGTPIYQGDIVQTEGKGAVNITFVDQTTMAISENARLAVDQYTYDPHTESGTTNFSVLRGLFVFTSGLIGRDDPDDVKIDTPVGSIGIRGTIIAGEINPHGDSKISVLEGAIVVTNGQGDTTLSHAYETVKLSGYDKPMVQMGVIDAHEISERFSSVSAVAPTLFTSVNDSANEHKSAQPAHIEAPVQHNDAPASDKPADEHQSQNLSPSQDQQTTAPAQSFSPPVASFDNGLATLNGTSTGLPTTNTALGLTNNIPSSDNSSGLPSTSAALGSPVSNAITTAAGTTTTDAGQITTQAAGITSTAPAISGGDVLQPPPSVIAANAANATGATTGSTGSSVGTTAPPTPGTFTLVYTTANLTDATHVGAVIGHITTATGLAGVTYAFTSSSVSPYYDLVNSGNGVDLVLKQAGLDLLNSSFDLQQLTSGNISVNATATNGDTGTLSFMPQISDDNSAAHINLDDTPNSIVSVIGDNLNNGIGYTITSLGDINGDGFADFAFSNNTTTAGQNHSYVIYGSAAHLPSDFSNLPAATQVISNPTALNGNTSEAVIVGIGDFNGDGIGDYAVGEQFSNILAGTNIASGNAAIISGDNPGIFQVFGTGFSGAAVSAGIGTSIGAIGDFNNDGYTDVIIGAPGTNMAYYVGGGIGAFGTSLSGLAIPVNGATSFGETTIGIGDFNGDGYNDFAIGAPGAGANNNGTISVYYGNATHTLNAQVITGATNENLGFNLGSLGDINGDGKSDIIASGGGSTGHIYLGGSLSSAIDIDLSSLTGTTVSGGGGIGDFNGDGYDDFVITTENATGSNAFIVFGKNGFSGTIDAEYLKDHNNAIELTKTGQLGNGEGVEIGRLGDINGDGYDDFALGVNDINGTSNGTGGLYIVYGNNNGTTTTGTTAAADGQHLVGSTSTDIFSDGGFNGVSMRGGSGGDVFHIQNTNFLGIDGGGNVAGDLDRIVIDGNSLNLNFSGIDSEKISGVEAIQFGNNDQTMTLTLENLFNLMKSSDGHSLIIDTSGTGNVLNIDAANASGNAADNTAGNTNIVNALNEMGSDAVNLNDNSDYRHFTIGGMNLYIDKDVTVNVT